MKVFRKNELLFPRRVRKGPQKGELIWEPLHHQRVLQVVHNPRYAGAFVWGRRKGRRLNFELTLSTCKGLGGNFIHLA